MVELGPEGKKFGSIMASWVGQFQLAALTNIGADFYHAADYRKKLNKYD